MAKLNGLYKSLEKALGGADESVTRTILDRFQTGAKSIDDLSEGTIKRLNDEFGEFAGKSTRSKGTADDFVKSTHASTVEMNDYADGLAKKWSNLSGNRIPEIRMREEAMQKSAAARSEAEERAERFRQARESRQERNQPPAPPSRSAQLRSRVDEEQALIKQAEDQYGSGAGSYANAKDRDIVTRQDAYANLRRERQTKINTERRASQREVDEIMQDRKFTPEVEAQMNAVPREPTYGGIPSSPARTAPVPADTVTGATAGRSVNDVAARRSGSGLEGYIRKQQGSKYDYDNIMGQHTDPTEAYAQMGKVAKQDLTGASEEQARAALTAGLNQRVANPNMMDKMGYHKVPQAAAGIGATAFLVSKMSESKGQMSNSQLYGQSSPYGM